MYYQWKDQTLVLDCRIQPRAATDCFVIEADGSLKVRIMAPPVEGKANQHLVKFLSRQFKTTQANICILSGQNNKLKRISITRPGRLPPELKIVDQ